MISFSAIGTSLVFSLGALAQDANAPQPLHPALGVSENQPVPAPSATPPGYLSLSDPYNHVPTAIDPSCLNNPWRRECAPFLNPSSVNLQLGARSVLPRSNMELGVGMTDAGFDALHAGGILAFSTANLNHILRGAIDVGTFGVRAREGSEAFITRIFRRDFTRVHGSQTHRISVEMVVIPLSTHMELQIPTSNIGNIGRGHFYAGTEAAAGLRYDYRNFWGSARLRTGWYAGAARSGDQYGTIAGIEPIAFDLGAAVRFNSQLWIEGHLNYTTLVDAVGTLAGSVGHTVEGGVRMNIRRPQLQVGIGYEAYYNQFRLQNQAQADWTGASGAHFIVFAFSSTSAENWISQRINARRNQNSNNQSAATAAPVVASAPARTIAPEAPRAAVPAPAANATVVAPTAAPENQQVPNMEQNQQ